MTREERAEEVARNVFRAYDVIGPKQASFEILAYADEIRREALMSAPVSEDGVLYLTFVGRSGSIYSHDIQRGWEKAAIMGKE